MALLTPAFTNYQEVLEYFRRFLNREIEHSPCDSFMPETAVIQPQLLDINRAGILSFSSQPGIVSIDTIGALIVSTYSQRAYLSCYMKRDLAHKLYRKFEKLDIAMFMEELDTLSEDVPFYEEITFDVETTSRDVEIAVTQVRSIYYNPETISPQKDIDVETTVPLGYKFEDLEIILENTNEKHKHAIIKDLMQVHFIDSRWGRESELFDTLVSLLV